jgi:multicomponent Na+:H+ antiporter subunit D
MTELALPPALVMVLGAFLLPFLHNKARRRLLLGLPLLTLLLVWLVPEQAGLRIPLLGLELSPAHATAEGRLFATVFALMAAVGGLYALGSGARTLELVAAYVYAGSAIGVTFAGDLLTLFIFWELMAIGSTAVIFAANTEAAGRAAFRYLLVHLLGGVVLMAGIIAHWTATGSLAVETLEANTLGTVLILIGILVNAGAPPLSAWIADAYPEASPERHRVPVRVHHQDRGVRAAGCSRHRGPDLDRPVHGLLRNHLRAARKRHAPHPGVLDRQPGRLHGLRVGIGTEMALNGAAAHAFAHIIYKALLLMSAGSVLLMTGKRKCTDLGGLFQSMPRDGHARHHRRARDLRLSVHVRLRDQVTGDPGRPPTKACCGLDAAARRLRRRLPACRHQVSVVRVLSEGLGPAPAGAAGGDALGHVAVLVPSASRWASSHSRSMRSCPIRSTTSPTRSSTWSPSSSCCCSAGFAFFVLLSQMRRTLTISLDFDWFYRKFLHQLADEFTLRTARARAELEDRAYSRVRALLANLYKHHGPHGILARSSPTGSMVLWVALMLGCTLLLYIF